ncbi:MAG: sulfatase-like hydrolase/transferase [Desulfobulbaceae bacterium]|nr:sulfatase-like hydrolase/transferase [Desulfobulbaceae bacterium]
MLKLKLDRNLINSTALAVYAAASICFFEWLFFFTKPSFLSALTTTESMQVLVVTILMVAMGAVVVHGLLWVIRAFLSKILKTQLSVFYVVVPFFLFWFLALLLIDNFSYTVFKFGIQNTHHGNKFFYGLFLCILGFFLCRKLHRDLSKDCSAGQLRLSLYGSASIVAVGFLVFMGKMVFSEIDAGTSIEKVAKERLPNILFVASDGIESDRLSLYGYRRKTTPFLDEFSKQSMVFENAYTNSSRTTGALTSMLTGKLPTETKVAFPPQVLSGKNSGEHLPGILKTLGYASHQSTVRYYADSFDLNMINGFDSANGRKPMDLMAGILPATWSVRLTHERLLIHRSMDRLQSRLLHLLGIRQMVNPFMAVKLDSYIYGTSDDQRIEETFEFVDGTSGPWFAHVHLMNSHCCPKKLKKRYRNFSVSTTGKSKKEKSTDVYDDMILAFDGYLKTIVDGLVDRQQLDKTIIIISSDHTYGWDVNERLPIIIRFPRGEYAAKYSVNTQLLDLAPTVLDYLDLGKPDWMEGDSLLGEKPSRIRPIYSVAETERRRDKVGKNKLSRLVDPSPPLYGLVKVAMTICQNQYTLNVRNGKFGVKKVKGHTDPCPTKDLPSNDEAKKMVVAHLNAKGFTLSFD